MTNSISHIPIYSQMIAILSNALSMLDEQGRGEVIHFFLGQQNADGGFHDRGGKSDLYYSLFGVMLLRAAELEIGELYERESAERNKNFTSESLLNLSQFISGQSTAKVSGFIEQCCLVLLQKELKTTRFSRIKSLIHLGRSFWKERYSINLSYRSFVLFLTLDAVLPFRGILIRAAERMLERTTVDEHSPCSEVAARVFLQKMMNRKEPDELNLLNSFVGTSGGFKAFQHQDQADMLSTAVALFVLDYVGYDLRLLKPDCLDFIQQNYSDGAFLSGDGDQTADVEYTFYGLLALGVLGN